MMKARMTGDFKRHYDHTSDAKLNPPGERALFSQPDRYVNIVLTYNCVKGNSQAAHAAFFICSA